jgi:hypothetical protein
MQNKEAKTRRVPHNKEFMWDGEGKKKEFYLGFRF